MTEGCWNTSTHTFRKVYCTEGRVMTVITSLRTGQTMTVPGNPQTWVRAYENCKTPVHVNIGGTERA